MFPHETPLERVECGEVPSSEGGKWFLDLPRGPGRNEEILCFAHSAAGFAEFLASFADGYFGEFMPYDAAVVFESFLCDVEFGAKGPFRVNIPDRSRELFDAEASHGGLNPHLEGHTVAGLSEVEFCERGD